MAKTKTDAQGRERRKNLRGQALVRVSYKAGGKTYHSYAENLSTGGLFIVADEALPVGAHLEVQFIPPRSQITIHVLAEVRWVKTGGESEPDEIPGMGVSFVERLEPERKAPRTPARPATPTPKIPIPPLTGGRMERLPKEPKPEPASRRAAQPSPASRGTQPARNRATREEEPNWARAVARRVTNQESSQTNADVGEPTESLSGLAPRGAKVEVATPVAAQSKPAPGNRRTARVHLSLQLDLKTESNFYVGLTENISSGGVFIATYDMLPLGTEVLMTFSLANRERPFAIYGQVRWIRPFDPKVDASLHPGMGVQFSNVNPDDAAAITHYIRKIRDPYFVPDAD